ncbi:ABC transporter ATP-binding protein [Photobacterium sanguinicancri]|uniref:Sulfate ABC transporter permease n=1 Tax=Photobacterium sanguinicancri TaxID=875932 RepID=A0ABX4FRR3_9GAMM|nr:ABC transporter ATP-binding protein [Photobacterium sanguinicancri]OZS41522.1 sulfate ABC transporter permease [Photobacterium sanguinicancri]
MLRINTLKRLTGTSLDGLNRTVFLTVVDAFFASAPYGFLYYILLDMLSDTPNLQHQFMLVLGCAGMMIVRVYLVRIIHLDISLIGFDAGKKIRQQLGEHLRKMPMGFFQRTDFGSVNNTLLKDIDMIERIFTHLYAPIIATTSVLCFFALGLLLKDWRMGVAMMSTLPLACLAYLLTRAYARKWQSHMQYLMHQLNDAVMEYMDGLKELKSYRMMGKAFSRLDDVLTATQQQSLKAEKAAVWPVYSFNVLVEAGLMVLLVALTWAWLEQTIALPEVLLFLIAAVRFFRPLLNMSMFLAELNYLDLAVNRVNDVLDQPTLQHGDSQPKLDDMTITFKGVNFSYPGAQQPLFENLDLSIPSNKVTALVGPSGSGKSTIASLIARFWQLDSGEISVGTGTGKVDIANMPVEYWLQHLSIVFQSNYIFNDTLANNLRVAKADASDEELWRVIELAKLKNLVLDMDLGLDTEIGAGGMHLSGGEKQRLSIARALLKDAPFVILDEATASLDPENERDIQIAMQALVQEKTVLVIAHKLTTIQYADHILVLDKGKIIEQGEHCQLLNNQSLYSELWNLQQQAQSWHLAV